MNLDDLRSTLAEHADAVVDHPRARIAPVHARVAAVRRRRAAAVVGVGVAAVVAAALAVVPTLHRQQTPPADRLAPSRLAGRQVPTTQTATGFRYRYVRGYQSDPGAGALSVDVPVGDRPRLVMWASSDTDTHPVVTVADRSTDDPPEVSSAGSFGRFTYLPATPGGRTAHLRVTQRDAGAGTRLGLAVYDLTRTPPPGVSNGTVTYREQARGESLLGAVIGTRGRSDLTLSVKVPSRDVSFAETCYGTRAWYTLSVAGREVLGTGCTTDPDLDPADGMSPIGDVLPAGVRAGDRVRIRVHLSPGSDRTGTVTRDPAAVLGIGVYTHSAPVHRVVGTEVTDLVDSGGHEWRAEEWLTSARGARTLDARMSPSDRPRLLRWFATGLDGAASTLQLRVGTRDGRPQTVDSSESAVGTSAEGSGYVVQPGATPRVLVTVPRGSTPHTRLALVVSEQLH